jgi:ectoine hydroxylase-related dioxygenase (phytanoyl-CoA dioxygenase family)
MTDNNQLNYSLDKNQIRIDYTTLTPRFTVTNTDSINNGITYLNEHGYAIFSDIMHEDEININKELLWNFLENIPGRHIQRNDPTTWSNNWPGNGRFGVINDCGIGQSDFMWNIRSNRNIKRVYSHIWNTNELLVSFDGCGIYRNWYYEPKWKTTTGWYHVDQNPILKPDRCCIQGFISLTNQNETTGGLIVFPYTHLRFQELKDLARRPKDFVSIPSTHSILDRGHAIGKFIQCQSGDLVLWDSRLVHCNSPAFVTGERLKNQSIDLLRIVAYVSMSPTIFIRDYTLDQFRKKRKLLAQNNCTLTHWSTDLTEASKNFIRKNN